MNPNEASANKTFNITTNGTTIIPVPSNPTQKWVLISVIVMTKGGSGHTAQIFDSNATLGANTDYKKGTLDTVNTLGNVPMQFPMYNGIYIVTGGGTAADLTVVYKTTP